MAGEEVMRLGLAGLVGVAGLVGWPAGPAAAQSYHTLVESHRLDRRDPVELSVDFAVGRFRLGPTEGPQLYRVSLTYLEEHFEPDVSYDPEEGSLHVSLEGQHGRNVNLKDMHDTRQRLDLLISPEVPLTADLKLGAVEADIELGGLRLEDATLHTGASRTTVRFSAPNRAACNDLTLEVGAAEFEVVGLGHSRCRSVNLKGGVGQITLDFSGQWEAGSEMEVSAEVGLGDVNLRVPETVGVQVNVDRFLVSLHLDGFTKRGSTWVSDGFDRARSHLIVDVNAAFGSVGVEWIR
jgi:hypothetical protein